MKRVLLTVAVFLAAFATVLLAQETVGEGDSPYGIDAAQEMLQQVSIDKFENAGFWTAYISPDDGISQARLFEGGPRGKADDPLPSERYSGDDPKIDDKFCLGVRVDFYRRAYSEIYILAQRPIAVEGITKTITVWVAGRKYNHTLKVIVQDFFNNRFELSMGKMTFQGWKKMYVSVPPQSPDGKTGIIQRNPHFLYYNGLKIIGFKIECDPMEAYGTFYTYFDDLRATTDLFAEDYRDEDDMQDGW